MKQYRVQYTPEWIKGPMTFWVHIEADGQPWYRASWFDPPAPLPVPGRGYPYFLVEVDGFRFAFASLHELDACVRTLSQKMLPSTDRETTTRRTGPSRHWLNRMPGWTHPWRYRAKAIKVLQEARGFFVKEVGSSQETASAAPGLE